MASLSLSLCADLTAQTSLGTWEAPFNHVVPASWINANGSNKDGEPKSPYLGTNDPPQRFLAGHMALIPRGPHRGKVLVWNWMRIHNNAPSNVQYWAIVDPVQKTFLNFALPMPIPSDPGIKTDDLFCAGHAWTKEGHLLVCGGNRHDNNNQLVGGNKLCYRFDPTVSPPGNQMWKQEPDMYVDRWYPTVTAMATDSNPNDPADRLQVAGGLDRSGSIGYQPTRSSIRAVDRHKAAGKSTRTRPTRACRCSREHRTRRSSVRGSSGSTRGASCCRPG